VASARLPEAAASPPRRSRFPWWRRHHDFQSQESA
jgi:hypothetical protein